MPPYHSPWQLVEEIGMLDHLTGGRLEIGTAAGIPQEMAQVGLGVDEARARYDEAVEIIDKALLEPVISHHGKFWNFDNLRLTPRPLQQPAPPPNWATVVSTSSARKAARRGAQHLYRLPSTEQGHRDLRRLSRRGATRPAARLAPDDLCIRRQVAMLEDQEALAQAAERFREFIKLDPRVDFPDRPAMLDTPTAHAFSIGDEEFIAGTPTPWPSRSSTNAAEPAPGILPRCSIAWRHPAQLTDCYRDFGAVTIPLLRKAAV